MRKLKAKNHGKLKAPQVEHYVAAIKAIQVAEVHNMLCCLRALRSSLSKEQLESPALKFFQENLPNLSVVRNEVDKVFELKPNEKNGVINSHHRASFVTAVGGLHFSAESVNNTFLKSAKLQIPDFALDGELDAQMSRMMGAGDSFQTPGVCCSGTSSKLSVGITPKTRLPKQGEMLLSVRGSPLGLYKEDNLEAINEFGDDTHAGSSG